MTSRRLRLNLLFVLTPLVLCLGLISYAFSFVLLDIPAMQTIQSYNTSAATIHTPAIDIASRTKLQIEFTKVKNIFDKYKTSDVQIIADGMTRSAWSFTIWARGFLKRTYRRGDTAELWIKRHTYRTDKGNIIYFKYPDGAMRPMRDVFLEELAVINKTKEEN